MWFPAVSVAFFVSNHYQRHSQAIFLILPSGGLLVDFKSLLENHMCELVGFSQCWLICSRQLQRLFSLRVSLGL